LVKPIGALRRYPLDEKLNETIAIGRRAPLRVGAFPVIDVACVRQTASHPF
jgi:hypothetical protein